MALSSSIGLALLDAFRQYAKAAVDKGDVNDDQAFAKILEGLRAAARQAGPQVLRQLLDWRRNLLNQYGRSNEILAHRRSLVTEALFLEAALALVQTDVDILTVEQASDLENLSVDWVLNAEKYADYRFQELHRLRDRVVLAAAQVLGALSPLRLESLTTRFLKEMGARIRADANSPQRQEILSMCHGLRFVRLSAATPEQFAASTNFLDRVHPLKHVAPDKKSRLQQAICDMLTSVLQPLSDETDPSEFGAGCPPEMRRKWAATVTVVRTDLLKWASKQNKQVYSGFPALAALTCMEEQGQLVSAIDSFIDQLHKQLKDKKGSSMAMLCLCRCVACFLRRMSPQSDPPRMTKWVQRGVTPAVQAMARGQLLAQEQQELMRQLCTIVMHHLPEYALSGMILELLSVDLQSSGGNWEAAMAGLMALLTVLVGAPGRIDGVPPTMELQATAQGLEKLTLAVWVPPPGASNDLLELIRDGYNPLQAYGVPHLMPKVAVVLSRVITACHQLHGYQRLTNPLRVPDAGSRERQGPLPVFVMALQCVPFVVPEHWAGAAIFDDLLSYSIHSEGAVRQVAANVLRRCMRALPTLRDTLTGSLATFIVRLPEDYPEVIKDCLAFLLSLMGEWQALVATEAALALPLPPESPKMPFSSMHRVEGAMLGLLCATDVGIRRRALDVLRAVRELHAVLAAPPPQPAISRRATLQSSCGDAAPGGRGSSAGNRRLTQQHQLQQAFESVPSTPGGAERLVFVADVIDRLGSSLVASCYWDFGRWSDLWRTWRPLPDPPPRFEDCAAAARSGDEVVRWARIICELMKEVWRRCEKSAWSGHLEIAAKLQALLSLDSNGRQVLPHDTKTDLCRAYCMAVAAAPQLETSQVGDKGLTSRDFARLLVSSTRSGVDSQQQIVILALGHVSASCQALAVQEAAFLAEDYLDRQMQRTISMPSVPGMGRSKVRRDDARLTQAHIYRVLSSNLPPGVLARTAVLRDKLVEFVRDTAKHITSSNADPASPELAQLRYCLAVVARHCSAQLSDALPQAFPGSMRRGLFDMFSLYCEEGQAPGQFRSDMRRSIAAAKARIKDPEVGRQLEAEIIDATETLEHVAYQGMAAMLQGPMFNADVRNPQGRVFGWIDRMLSVRQQQQAASRLAAWGPPKAAVARAALRNVLQSNPDLAGIYIDRSYASNSHIAAGYFQVLTEVYALQPLPLEPHVAVSLVLHKLVDTRQEVRDAARALLNVLSRRVWQRDTRYSDVDGGSGDAAAHDGTVVVGALADSHASYQLHLSARLAQEHTELSEALAIEVLTRQLDNDAHGDALLCLCPWLEFITLSTQWEGQWAESLLKSLYFITAHHSARHAHQIQKLWATLAANRRNIIPTLDFLIVKGLEETMTGVDRGVPASVGKQVALYLSRVAPRQTIDHLVYELAQQLTEAEAEGQVPDAHSPSAGSAHILEFHHKRSSATLQQSPMQTLQRVSASFGGGSSRPVTPSGASGSAFFNRSRMGLDALLQTQSAWSEASSHGGLGGPASVTGDGLAVESRRSSDARMSGGGGDGGGGAASAVGSRMLTRPELALCLLSEIAYEHDEEFRQHLPTLLHVATLNADSGDPVVCQESSQLLVFLLYSLACKHLEPQAGSAGSQEYSRVSSLISRLQALHGQPLWRREQPTLAQPLVASGLAVAGFVQAVVECFYFDTDLRDRWCGEALKWACAAHCRHCASRSHQVFTALRPALSHASCSAMLACLHKCLQSASVLSLDTAVEVLCTLRALQAGLDAPKVILFPQLLLACIALLNSSVVRVGELAMHILLQILARLDLNDATVQNTLLAVLPLPGEGDEENAAANEQQQPPSAAEELWPLGAALLAGVAEVDEETLGPWVALPQLVVKALFQPETELLVLETLAAIAEQVARSRSLAGATASKGDIGRAPAPAGSGAAADMFSSLSLASNLAASTRSGLAVEAAIGNAEIGLAVTLGAALPWVCIHVRRPESAEVMDGFLRAVAGACAAVGWHDLSASVAALTSLQFTSAETAAWLMPFCVSLCAAMFPTYARVVFQRLMETVQRGSEAYKGSAVAVMQAIFEVPGVDLGSPAWFAEDSQLAQLLSGLLSGPLAPQVLALFQAMLCYQGAMHSDEDLDLGQAIEWPRCMDDLGELNKLCTEALGRVVEPWGPGSRNPELLPFLRT